MQGRAFSDAGSFVRYVLHHLSDHFPLKAGSCLISRIQSCTQLPNGSYSKDLALVEQDLSRICLVDNSPICYSVNESAYSPGSSFLSVITQRYVTVNGIPIEGWTHDPSDEALLDLLPVLDSLRFTSDVRRVLGIRSYS